MSPTPVTMSDPTAPASYAWEATSEQVAARYGLPVESIVRFDLNTSPAPPELAARVLAAGRFETGLSEYPPSDYRRLTAAAAARYGVASEDILVGAGADEVLDIVGKAFLPADGTAVIPTPSYAMYRVLTEQRAARVRPVPRLGASAGYAIDVSLTRTIGRGADLVWLCSPNNPTALAEPEGAIADPPGGSGDRCRTGRADRPGRRPRRGLCRVHGGQPAPAPRGVSTTGRDPDAQQGLRPGRAPGRVRDRHPGHGPGDGAVPAAGLGVDGVGDRCDRGPRRPVDPRRVHRARR